MRGQNNQYDDAGAAFATPGTLALITGWNAGVNTLYFWLMDAAAIAAATPIADAYQVILLGPGAAFSYRPSEQAKPFGTACAWGVSSTAATFTAATDLVFVHSEFNAE